MRAIQNRFWNSFYGWRVLAAAFVASGLGGATTSYGFALFLIPLTTEFGWTRAAVSGAIALARLESGLIGPLEGILVDRLGPRAMMLFGFPLAGLGFLLLAQIDSIHTFTGLDTLLVFYIVYVLLVALGNSFAGNMAPATAVANWFVRRRGFSLGVFSSGHAIGAALWIPVLGAVIQLYGWREAVLLEGLALAIIGIPAALVVRHRPEDMGLLPDGDPVPPPSAAPAATAPPPPPRSLEPELTVREALRTSAFWVLAATFALRVLVTNAVQVHLAALLQDRGMSPLEAAAMLSALAGISVFGRFGMSWLADYVDVRRVFLVGMLMLNGGLLVVSYATSTWQFVLFMVLYSPAYGGLSALQNVLRGHYFGRRAYGSIAGAMSTIVMVGTIIGPLFAGYMYDQFGSYQLAMQIFVGCGVVTMALFALLKPRAAYSAPTGAHS